MKAETRASNKCQIPKQPAQPRKIIRKHVNVYYTRAYNINDMFFFIVIGAFTFTCSSLSDILDRIQNILIWVAYLLAVLVWVANYPFCVLELERTDKNGNPFFRASSVDWVSDLRADGFARGD